MARPAIDRAALAARCLHHRPLVDDLLRLFVEHVPAQFGRLEAAVAAGDGPAVCLLTHRLIGTAATVSADELHARVVRLERHVRAGDWPAATAETAAVAAEVRACLAEAVDAGGP